MANTCWVILSLKNSLTYVSVALRTPSCVNSMSGGARDVIKDGLGVHRSLSANEGREGEREKKE